MQNQYWDPLFKLMKEKYGVELALAEGFSPARQTEKTIGVLRGIMEEMDHFELAGE
jgi:ATP synthase F1 complex assembly factor 2